MQKGEGTSFQEAIFLSWFMEGGNLAILAALLTHTQSESKAGKYFNLQTEKESVALLGAHTLGRAMTSMSGFQVFFVGVKL